MKKFFSTICATVLMALASGAMIGCDGAGGGGGGELDSIKLTVKPTKTNYEVGETFSTDGMEVTAYYTDKTSKVVTDYTFEPSGALTLNDKKVTITYKTESASVSIKVFNPIKEATLKNPPTKTAYSEDDEFDPAGMVIHVVYKDNSEADLQPDNSALQYSRALTAGQTSVVVKISDIVERTVSVPITVGGSLQPKYKDVEYKEVNGVPTIIITGTTSGTQKSDFQFNMQVNNSSWQVIRPEWNIEFDGQGNFTMTADISGINAQGANQTWFPHFGLSKYAGAGDPDTDINLEPDNPDSPAFTCGGHRYTPVTNDKTFNMPGVIFDAPEDYVPPEPGNPNLQYEVAKVEYKAVEDKPTIIITGTTEAGAAKKDFQFNMQINGGDWAVYDSLPWEISFNGTNFEMTCDLSNIAGRAGTWFPHFGLSTSQGAGENNVDCDIHVTTPDSPAFTVGGHTFTPVTNELTFDMPGVQIA